MSDQFEVTIKPATVTYTEADIVSTNIDKIASAKTAGANIDEQVKNISLAAELGIISPGASSAINENLASSIALKELEKSQQKTVPAGGND